MKPNKQFEEKRCIVCFKTFTSWSKNVRKGKKKGTHRQSNAKTCSSECSKILRRADKKTRQMMLKRLE